MVLSLLLLSLPSKTFGEPQVTAVQLTSFDVGQGLSIWLKVSGLNGPDEHWIYDTGAAYPSGFNMVDAVIAPSLKRDGVEHIERIVLSHGDNDHSGGIDRATGSV